MPPICAIRSRAWRSSAPGTFLTISGAVDRLLARFDHHAVHRLELGAHLRAHLMPRRDPDREDVTDAAAGVEHSVDAVDGEPVALGELGRIVAVEPALVGADVVRRVGLAVVGVGGARLDAWSPSALCG